MITFISGMAVGAAALLGVFTACYLQDERKARNKKRRAKRAQRRQQERKGFCGDVSKNNDWMQETMRL